MTINKSLGILLILISLLLVSMSFGHEYVGELITASTLTITPTAMEVAPGSTVVLNFEFISSWGTREWNFNLDGGGYDSWTPKVTLAYGQPYYNSFTVVVPNNEGTVRYEIKPYFYVWYQGSYRTVGNPSQTVTITMVEPEIPTYNLTVKIIDSYTEPLQGVEVSINTGVIGTTDSSGLVTKQNLTAGPWTVTATKEGYKSDSASVSMTSDKTVTLQLIPIEEEPTPTPTGEPTEEPTEWPTEEPGETPIGDIQLPPPPLKYNFVIEMLDNNDPQGPIPDVKIMINGRTHYSDAEGKVIYISDPGEALSVVITKEGYNTFKKSYVVTSNTVVKITLSPSGGDYFLDLDFEEDNPFYDPEGLFNVMPTWVAVSAALSFVTGAFLLTKKKET